MIKKYIKETCSCKCLCLVTVIAIIVLGCILKFLLTNWIFLTVGTVAVALLFLNCCDFKHGSERIFSDSPRGLKKNTDDNKKLHKKISDLNTFYYISFNCEFLTPLFAWLIEHYLIIPNIAKNTISTVQQAKQKDLSLFWSISCAMLVIALLMLSYIPRIYLEIKHYKKAVYIYMKNSIVQYEKLTNH